MDGIEKWKRVVVLAYVCVWGGQVLLSRGGCQGMIVLGRVPCHSPFVPGRVAVLVVADLLLPALT